MTNKKLLLHCSAIAKGLMMHDRLVQSFSGEDPEYVLTDRDYLTLRKGEDMPLMGGVPTDSYLGVRIYKNHCICGPMLEKLLRREPNVQELHCILSATPPLYIAHDEHSYGAERKYAALRYNISGVSKRPGPYPWMRAKMVDETNTCVPWYCLCSKPQNKTAKEKEIEQQVIHDFAQDFFHGAEQLVYVMDLSMMVNELIINSLTYSLVDDTLFNMYKCLRGDPKLIKDKVAQNCQLIQQRQQELFMQHGMASALVK